MRILIILFCALLLQACVALVETGREFPVDKVDQLNVGTTTIDDVKTRFGEPVSLAQNTVENRTVLSYRASLEKAFTLGIPPVFMYSWRSSNGKNLNIVFIDDIYRGHELVTHQ